jgi:hypothetical protein
MEIVFLVSLELDFFCGIHTAGPRTADAAFEVANVSQFEIQEHQGFGCHSPGRVIQHVLKSVQCMHAFTGAASIFFGPAPTTGLGLFTVEELFT